MCLRARVVIVLVLKCALSVRVLICALPGLVLITWGAVLCQSEDYFSAAGIRVRLYPVLLIAYNTF